MSWESVSLAKLILSIISKEDTPEHTIQDITDMCNYTIVQNSEEQLEFEKNNDYAKGC